jgi:hypothetical protein
VGGLRNMGSEEPFKMSQALSCDRELKDPPEKRVSTNFTTRGVLIAHSSRIILVRSDGLPQKDSFQNPSSHSRKTDMLPKLRSPKSPSLVQTQTSSKFHRSTTTPPPLERSRHSFSVLVYSFQTHRTPYHSAASAAPHISLPEADYRVEPEAASPRD